MKKDEIRLIETDYADAERVDPVEVLKTYDDLAGNQLLSIISDAMPDVAMILNHQRQVVFTNKALLSLLDGNFVDDILGKRPGELFECLHATESDGGCGTTRSCRYCGVVNSILECQVTGLPLQKECRISSESNGNSIQFDLQVNVSPFRFNNTDYVIMAIKDISDQKRRKELERMFFHDILNTAAGLKGLLVAMKGSTSSDEVQNYLELAEKASNDLIDDIVSQRALNAAEAGDLQLKVIRLSTLKLLHEVAAYLSNLEITTGKRILVDPFSHSVLIETDPQLLKRVLINLVKNALEASPEGSVITLGSRIGERTILFWVNNPGQMSAEVKSQIFQRSFSTKGKDRGIGTFSARLLTNRYLKGIIEFESDEANGTTFRVELPMGI